MKKIIMLKQDMYKCQEEEDVEVEKCGPPASQSVPTYTLKRAYHIHGTNRTLRKLVAHLYSKCTHGYGLFEPHTLI